MTVTAKLEVNVERMVKRLGRNGTLVRALAANLRHELGNAAADWEREMKTRQFVSYTGSARANKLQTRSGGVRQSIRFRRFGSGFRSGVLMFSTHPAAPVHEHGGVIRGRPWLSFPLSDTLTPSGGRVQARYQTNKRAGEWRTRDGEPTWIHRDKGSAGPALIMGNIRGEPKALRVLTRSVRIPGGRLKFFATWRKLRRSRARRYSLAYRSALRGRRRVAR